MADKLWSGEAYVEESDTGGVVVLLMRPRKPVYGIFCRG